MASSRICLIRQILRDTQQVGINNKIENELLILIDDYNDDEFSLRSVLLFVHQLIDENKINLLTTKVLQKLVNVIITQKPSKAITANIMFCIHVYIKKSRESSSLDNLHDIKLLLADIWQLCLQDEQQSLTAVVLVQILNDFIAHIEKFIYNASLSTILRKLLDSEVREDRKSAYFIMKQLTSPILACPDNDAEQLLSVWGWRTKTNFKSGWPIYISILENLEENQSHLILPSLATIRFIVSETTTWNTWMNIIYRKLLTHNNAIILRWSLEYLMQTFTCSQMNNILLQLFMEATNNTNLYNVEPKGYYLSEEKALQFISNNNLRILEVISTINWKPVPLHYWLKRVEASETNLSKELLLKLATKIRILTNTVIRKALCSYFMELFKLTIDNMNVNDYMDVIESLYNIGDNYYDQSRYFEKLQNFDGQLKVPTKRFYQIFINYHKYELPFQCNQIHLTNDKMIERFQNMPIEQYGWFRFLFVFDVSPNDNVHELVKSKYQLDLRKLKEYTNWQKIYEDVSAALLCDTLEEQHFVRKKSIDYFTTQCMNNWQKLISSNANIFELVDGGSEVTFLSLCTALRHHKERNVPDEIIHKLIDELQKYSKICVDSNYSPVWALLDYIERFYSEDTLYKFMETILKLEYNNIIIYTKFYQRTRDNKFLINALIDCKPKTGDPRIEGVYEVKILEENPKSIQLRSICEESIPYSNEVILELIRDLLKLNNELTIKKPRYFEHSKEHRIKMRICRVVTYLLAHLTPPFDSADDIWQAVFGKNNQLNISYIYEVLIAKFIKSDELLKKLKDIGNLNTSQQISLISIIYTYVMLNWESRQDLAKRIVTVLKPLAMGSNFQVRSHAQITLKMMYEKAKRCDYIYSKCLIELSNDNLSDVRLKFPELLKTYSVIDVVEMILYVTNTPFDECAVYPNLKPIPEDLQKELDKARETFINKSKMAEEEFIPQTANVQMKMNPTNDILFTKDFTERITDFNDKDNMIVVASLITKLPYLGGLARSCEVLGIKNLILSTKSHIIESDFKNLSMTAEKSLNISEVKPVNLLNYFLIKKREGYSLIGAEETAGGVSLKDFTFPEKSILVLGHETNGIPKDLQDILDYFVYVPNSGGIQSLCVHATGALFMWEYCKQMNEPNKLTNNRERECV